MRFAVEEESFPDLTLTATAGNDLPGNITLSGNINVDSLTANADNNITADASSYITSYNTVPALSAGGNVETRWRDEHRLIQSPPQATISPRAAPPASCSNNDVQLRRQTATWNWMAR